MGDPRFLVDTSVLARAPQAAVGQRLEALLHNGRLWTCRLIDLELVYATRAGDVASVCESRRALPEAPITPEVMDRALEVMEEMTGGGHRDANPVDFVIAAAAELSGLTVLHYDIDFARISAVTGQAAEWVAPPGSLDRPPPRRATSSGGGGHPPPHADPQK